MMMEAMSSINKPNQIREYWDVIKEYEIDPSWWLHQSADYLAYREKFELAKRQKYLGPFPLSIEIEASYHCNLECPFCPRAAGRGERQSNHMAQSLWQKILKECEANRLSAMLMDHEAESMMNPRFFDMVREAKNAGILDIWLHTNANMLSPERSARLVDEGLTRMNFSIDAFSEPVYDVVRTGGNFRRVIENVREFLKIKQDKQAYHVRTRVSFVVQKDNAHETEGFFNYWKSEPGLNMISFQECIDFLPFEKPDEDRHLSEAKLEQKYADSEPFHCSQPWESPVIDTEGNVFPCGVPIREHSKEFILGNVNGGDTIKSCWNGTKMEALRELHRRGKWYKNPVCRTCVNTLRRSHPNLLAMDKPDHLAAQ